MAFLERINLREALFLIDVGVKPEPPSARITVSPCPSSPLALVPQHLTVASSCDELQVRLLHRSMSPNRTLLLPTASPPHHSPLPHWRLVTRTPSYHPLRPPPLVSCPHTDPSPPLTAHYSPEHNASQTSQAPAPESSHPHLTSNAHVKASPVVTEIAVLPSPRLTAGSLFPISASGQHGQPPTPPLLAIAKTAGGLR